MIHVGDALTVLRTMPDESAHCVVTSPPYWGLRDYGVEGQLGLERTPEEYLDKMVAVFHEARRVLRGDGTAWVNMGDSYATHAKGSNGDGTSSTLAGVPGWQERVRRPGMGNKHGPGLKEKDLCGIPWRLALALQADGWYLRSDIIWHKPNPMPESVTDRPTKAHEYVFLLSKSARYFYDAEAIREADSGQDHPRSVLDGQPSLEPSGGLMSPHAGLRQTDGRNGSGRNARSVWTIATQPFPEAHFATFPEALAERCIRAGCPEGGTVLDPFGGAGTVGLVSAKLNRDYVLIELKPEYAAMASRRIRGALPLFVDDPLRWGLEEG